MSVRSLAIITLCAPAILLSGTPQDEVTLLRWAGPPDSKPGTFKEWIVSHPYTNFSVKLGRTVIGNHKGGTLAILIDSTIASPLTDETNQLMTDLQEEGYTVSSYEISGGTPENLRSFLQGLYNTSNIEGALFIGNLPVAWFQVKNDFNVYGYAEWPIDLFYMDIDGSWFDTLKYDPVDTLVPGQDSIYDAHFGNLSPEIYIGRLTPTGIGDDTLLIKNYLSKDNAYRQHTIELQHRALVYVDDDWFLWAPWWAQDVSLLYNDTLVVSDSNTTRASDYKVRLDTVRAWVSVFAHSWPGGHAFYYNDSLTDYYYSSEYTSQDPPSNFYNHFACSFARYTEDGYGGGRAIFNQSYGVGAIGSAKTGSMLEFNCFYLPLSQGKTIGDAFKDWFSYIASDGVTFSELCWHYGMTLLGDPFLKPIGHTLMVPSLISPDSGLATNDTVVTFVWHKTFNNAKYMIKIDSDTIETTDTTYIDTLTEGSHQWCVKTGNLAGNWSVYSNPWELIVDTTSPLIVTLISPSDGVCLSDSTVNFVWNSTTDNLSDIDHYVFQYALDNSFSQGVVETTLVDTTFTVVLSDTTYYWKARAVDNATNQSDWSDVFTLFIDTQPPQISNTTIWEDTSFQGPFPVYSTITDNRGIKKAELQYKTSADTNWVFLPMDTTGVDNEYQTEIPSQTNNTTVWYYIYSEDIAESSNVARDPKNAPDSCYSFIAGYVGIEISRQIPKIFFISQNYPNPFTVITEIRYGLPEDSYVNITVYNLAGQRVAVLVDEHKRAGCHTARWDARHSCSSGIYFLVFQSHTSLGRDYKQTKKIVLTR